MAAKRTTKKPVAKKPVKKKSPTKAKAAVANKPKRKTVAQVLYGSSTLGSLSNVNTLAEIAIGKIAKMILAKLGFSKPGSAEEARFVAVNVGSRTRDTASAKVTFVQKAISHAFMISIQRDGRCWLIWGKDATKKTKFDPDEPRTLSKVANEIGKQLV